MTARKGPHANGDLIDLQAGLSIGGRGLVSPYAGKATYHM